MEPIPPPPNPFLDDFGQLVLPPFEACFMLPGDWAVYVLASRLPAVAEPFGIGPADYGGTLAGSLAWLSWIALAVASIAAVAAVRRFDDAVTHRIAYGVLELRRRVRMAMVFARYRHAQRNRRVERTEPSFELGELPSLSRDELRALALHAKLAPGFALTVRDVAEELNARVHEMRAVLERLQRLELLRATVGGFDGDTSYTLTQAGRGVLQALHTRPRTA